MPVGPSPHDLLKEIIMDQPMRDFTDLLLRRGVVSMDQIAEATTVARDNDMPIMVFNINEPGNLLRAVRGEAVGTMVREDADA